MTSLSFAPSRPDCAVILLAHGSARVPGSSDSAWACRDRLRAAGCFGGVHCAFWREEPSLRSFWPMVEHDDVRLVPFFLAEGWFTKHILPRELELDGPLTHRGNRTMRLCSPVGTHPGLTELLRKKALAALEAGEGDSGDCALILAGHGTRRNRDSTHTARHHVDALQAKETPFHEITAAFLDDEPNLRDWPALVSARTIVVVPFLIADGLHGSVDIPEILGFDRTGICPFPMEVRQSGDRTIIRTGAIGSDPGMAQLVIDQVASRGHHDPNR